MDEAIFSSHDNSKNSWSLSKKFTKEEQENFLAWKRKADKGCANAQFLTGLCYKKGNGVEQSYQSAFHYFKLAADQGYAYAQYEITKAYQNGLGIGKNQQLAFQYCKMAADQNLPEAQNTLAIYFEYGMGVEKSLQEAVKYLQLSADQGYALAQSNLGLYFKQAKGAYRSDKKAFEYFKLAADQGLAVGQYYVGGCFKIGTGVQQSDEEAVKYFQLAADQGFAKAQYHLGICFQDGKGVPRSAEKAFEYLKSAADQGILKARQFMNETRVSKIKKKAINQGLLKAQQITKAEEFTNFKSLADRGNADAQLIIGKCYQDGRGTEKSLVEACKYYKLAGNQGDVNIQFQVAGAFYQIGDVLEESLENALYYYQLAAYQNHIPSIKVLFKFYHYGKDFEESQEALQYLKLGAKLNDPECQYELGRYYEHGWGILCPFLREAFKYYKLAAEQGYQRAIKCLKARILQPNAQEVIMHPYLQDQKIATLEAILKSYGTQPIFLEKTEVSLEEAQVICSAMIENPQFTFMCSKDEVPSLLLAFKRAGYDEDEDLIKFCGLINPSTQKKTYACVFIGRDVKDQWRHSGSQDQPTHLEKMHLERILEDEREKNKAKARQIWYSLPQEDIIYPDSQELNLDAYLEDRKIDNLRKIFASAQNLPIYIRISAANYEEIAAIRDAMIKNPKLTLFCKKSDGFRLEKSFYQAGYKECLKRKEVKIDEKKLWGFVFSGNDMIQFLPKSKKVG